MDLKEYIETTIREDLKPQSLRIHASAPHHKSGVGYHEDGGRFLVEIVSSLFQGKKPVERERMVTRLFKKELANKTIHVLRVIAKCDVDSNVSHEHFAGSKQ